MDGVPGEMVGATMEKVEGQLIRLWMTDTVMMMDETKMVMNDTMLKMLHLQDRDEGRHVVTLYARHYEL